MSLIERFNIFKKNFYIVAIDYDNTLTIDPDGTGDNSLPLRTELIEILKSFKATDVKIKYILWTCREGVSLMHAIDRCNDAGLYFDAINDNIPEMIEFFNGGSRKITYDILIDDKNISLNEMLIHSEDILLRAMRGEL